MSNPLRDLVKHRINNQGVLSPSFLHSVSVRIDPDLVPEIDLLVTYLGYPSRSGFLRELIEASLEDLVPLVAREVKHDPDLSEQFRADFDEILAKRLNAL